MPVQSGVPAPCAVAGVVRPSLTVPDLTLVTAARFKVLFPDRTTAFWACTIPGTVPANVRGLESLAGATNPSTGLLVLLYTFNGTETSQLGVYLVKALLTVTGASNEVWTYARQLIVEGEFGQ